ncbi:acid-sensing ion channel 2-like [Oculina patagonica]
MCYTMIKQVKPINSPTDPSKEKVESKKSSFYTKWKVFASDTTLHGLRYVVQSGISIPRRATWLIFLCVTGSAYLYYSTTSFEKFMSRPIKTIISQETPIKGLKFPAVTICNLNKFMKSKIDMADVDENFEKLGLNISGCSETRAVRGNLTCGQALLCAFHPFGYGLVDNCNASMRKKIVNVLNHTSERLFNEEQFLAKFGHDLAGMFFLYCRFSEEEEVCSEKEFVPTLTRKGICYTFNSGDNNSSLFYSEMEGPELGLSILLNVQTNESTLSEYSTGLQVIVHDQKTFVNRNIGFNILPGTHASVAVKLREHKRLQAPFETNCSSQNEIPGVGNYTKDACVYQCYANMTSDICGCHYAGFPGVRQLPVCSFQDQRCIKKARKAVNLTECPCNNACSELEYESRVSYSKFPDTSIIKLLRNVFRTNVSVSYMQENYVFLQVGFQHMAYEKRQEFPSYGPESLFGELGGNMGLFLGCSLLTICEFIDFLWEVLMSKIRKRSADVNAQPNDSYY